MESPRAPQRFAFTPFISRMSCVSSVVTFPEIAATDHFCIRVRRRILLFVVLFALSLALVPLGFALALTSIGAGPVSVSRAMMMLLTSSHSRRCFEQRAASMSVSSSSMPFWTTAICTRSDKISPQIRSYLGFELCARTSSSNDVFQPTVAGSCSATSLCQLSNPSQLLPCSSKRC